MAIDESIFFRPAIINDKTNLNHERFNDTSTGFIIFCNQDKGIYVRLQNNIARFGGMDIIDDLTSTSISNPLSANMGRILKQFIDLKVNTSDIVDTVKSDSNIYPLSARQGKILNEKIISLEDNKVNVSDIIDSLESSLLSKPLSANQGKVLNERLTWIENRYVNFNNRISYLENEFDKALTTDSVVDNVATMYHDKPLAARQGTLLSYRINDLQTDLNNKFNSLNNTDSTNYNDLNTKITNLDNKKVNTSDIINNLTNTSTNKPLSANMGKTLYEYFLNLYTDVSNINDHDVIDNLTSTSTIDGLSANQGKILKDLYSNLKVIVDQLNENAGYNVIWLERSIPENYYVIFVNENATDTESEVDGLEGVVTYFDGRGTRLTFCDQSVEFVA